MKICITSDIHFERVLKEENGYNNMVKYFKDTLEYIKPELFIIAGDLTDSRNLRFETPEANKLVEFMKTILDITQDINCELIVLKGTPSHDGDIVKNLKFVTDEYDNFLHIEEMCRKRIKGLDFVFIPEIYRPTEKIFMDELNAIVSEQDKANIIIFHGMFDFAIPAVKQIDSKHNLSRSVVMNSHKLSRLADLLIGGHVHSFINEKNIYYTGRFINERGHDHTRDVYGLKKIDYEKGRFRVINIDNPYVIKQKRVVIDLVKYNYDDEIIRSQMKGDPKDTIYEVIIDSKTSPKIKQWRSVYNPLYIKRTVLSTNSNNTQNDVNVDVGLVSNMDVKNLLTTIYKDKFGEKLDDTIIKMIELGDDYID